MRSAVTVSLVPSLAGGPWIYWDAIGPSLARASAAGFEAVELFADAPDPRAGDELQAALAEHRLRLAAVGTGAGKVLHGLTLTDADPAVRRRARDYVKTVIRFGARFGAPAIIGSMQGSVPGGAHRTRGVEWLGAELQVLARIAADEGVPLLYETLNRYETNVFNRIPDAAAFLADRNLTNVRLLADLFHMNIEEPSLAQTILEAGAIIGHVHFADSNRRPVGLGHIDMPPVVTALKSIGYKGYISAEALAYPNPDAAAAQTMQAFRKWFG